MLPVTRFSGGASPGGQKRLLRGRHGVRKGHQSEPGFHRCLHPPGHLLYPDGSANVAEQVLRVGLQRQPKMASLHNNLGFVLLLARRYPEAETEFREA